MKDLLYQIFNGEYDITPERDEKQQELSRLIQIEQEKIRQTLGLEFLDRLNDLETQRYWPYVFQYYRAGFVLGARLMLEALGPAQ